MTARPWLKRIALAALALAVVFAGAVATALVLVDTQDLRRVIERRVEAATGRALAIEGALDISLFPWLGFELGRTRLANAAGFGDEPFVALERAELRVEVLPLLTGRVALDRVVLHGLELHLARAAGGTTNWADLAVAGGGDETATAAGDTAAGGGAAGGGAAAGSAAAGDKAADAASLDLRIEALDVRDATITWHDAAAGRRLRVSGLDLATGALAPGEPIPLELRLRVAGAGLPQIELDASARLVFDLTGPRIRLSELDAALEARGAAVPSGRLQAGLAGDAVLDLGAGEARLDDLVLSAAQTLRATGSLRAAFADAFAARGRLSVEPFDPRALARRLGSPLPEPAGAGAMQRASAALEFRATAGAVEFEGIEARLDDSRLRGTARVEAGEVPRIVADLALDAIDLDAYLPASAGAGADGEAGAGASAAGAGADPVASLPLEPLRGLNARLALDVGRIGYRGLDLRDARLRVRLAEGVLRLERADVAAAGGRLGLSGRLDASTDAPAVELSADIGGAQAEPLLTALAGAAPLLGRLDADLAARTRGATLDAWTRALSGRFEAIFRDGAVRGINLARTLRLAGARLAGGDVEAAAAERRTDFSVLRIAATIRDGIVRSDRLDLRTPLLRVSGAGQADLAARTVDYTARVLVTATLAGQGGAAASDLAGLTVPVRVSGAWSHPSIDVLLDEALKARAERELEREKAAAKRELQREKAAAKRKARQALEREREAAEDKLKKELKGLFD